MNTQVRKIKAAIKARGFCAVYVVTGDVVHRLNVTKLDANTISGFNYGTKEDEVIAMSNVTELTILG